MLHFDFCIASICSDSGLFCRRKLKFIFLCFRQYLTAPRTIDFSKITHSQKHYRTSLKLQISTRLRPRKHQNVKFRIGSVDFFDCADSWLNGFVASWRILPYFSDEKRSITNFRRKKHVFCEQAGPICGEVSGFHSKCTWFASGRRCVRLPCVHRCKRFASGRRCVRLLCAYIPLPRRNGRSPGRSAAASGHQRRVRMNPATS